MTILLSCQWKTVWLCPGEDVKRSKFQIVTSVRSYKKPLAPVVQSLDNAICWINHYPVDKYQQNKPRYPLDSDLSGG